MALKDKLDNLSQQISMEKEAAAEAKVNENLKPIRANIKKLEKEKLDLEMIKNSLDFKQDKPEDGLGMKDYATKTADNKRKKRGQLEEIAKDNEEALEKIGVKNIDDLANNPDFAEEEEVVAYKKANQQAEDLRLSDAQLKKRLAGLEININDENFSYQAANEGITKRLEDLKNNLWQEKLKTPEGKEEVSNSLAEEFTQNTKDISFRGLTEKSKNLQDKNFDKNAADLVFEAELKGKDDKYGDNLGVSLFGNKAVLNNLHNLRLLPANFQEQLDRFGSDLASESLKKAYTQKLDTVFSNQNILLGKANKTKADFERICSPEKKAQAIAALSKFELKRSELLTEIKIKSEDLSQRGIKFSAEFPANYGASYKEIFSFSSYNGSAKKFAEQIKANNNLFPDYDYDKIKEITKQRINELNQALETIKNIKDKETADNFTRETNKHSDSVIGKFHSQARGLNLYDQAGIEGHQTTEMNNLSKQFNSYETATTYLDKEIATLDNLKKQVTEKLTEAVDYKVLELQAKQQYGPDTNLGSLESMVKQINRDREQAQATRLALAKIQTKLLPSEVVQVDGLTIEVPSKIKERDDLAQEITTNEQTLNTKKQALSEQKGSKPWFGKEKWQQQIKALEQEINNLEMAIPNLRKKMNQAVQGAYLSLDISNLSTFDDVKKIVSGYSATAKASEVFVDLDNKLSAIEEKQVPAETQQYYDKLKDLQARLLDKV